MPAQPGDVSFVLDELLAMSSDPSSPLAGRIDPSRLGAAGLSAGGWTTYRVAVDPASRDPRFRAAIAISAPDGLFGADSGPGADVPVLVLHGDADPIVPASGVVAGYEALTGTKYLVTLLGGGHAGPFEDAEDALEEHRTDWTELVAAVTVDFWDRYLLDRPEAGDELVATAQGSDLVTFRHEPG